MTLKTLFAVPVAIILIVALAVGGRDGRPGMDGAGSRGRVAVDAVLDMRILLRLQSDLRSERVVTNFALGQDLLPPDHIGAFGGTTAA